MSPTPFDITLLPSTVKFARVIDFGRHQSNGYNPSRVDSIILLSIENFTRHINNWMPVDGVSKSGRRIEFLDHSKDIICSTYVCSKGAKVFADNTAISPVITWNIKSP